jgi:hypothetical protein
MKNKRKKLSETEQQRLEQARKQGYLLSTAELSPQVRDRYRHWCNEKKHLTIVVEMQGEYATVGVDLRAVLYRWKGPGMVDGNQITARGKSEIGRIIEHALHRFSCSQGATYEIQVQQKAFVLKQLFASDVKQIVSDLTGWWSQINQDYEAYRRTRQEQEEAERRARRKQEEAYRRALQEAEEAEQQARREREEAWQRERKRVLEQNADVLPSCVDIPLPSDLASLLSKERMCAFLSRPLSRKELKADLFAELMTWLEDDPLARARFFELFAEELSVEPWELEKLLGCTTTERKRWVADGKLVPSGWRTVEKSRSVELTYPVFERRYVASFPPEKLAGFRAEHAALVALNRKTGAKRAQETRSAYAQARKLALREVEEMFGEWARLDFPELAAVLRLSFWTVWASRWAKENILLSQRAIKHGALYRQRQSQWYRKKDEALAVLAKSSYVQLAYYRPEEPDKIELQLCSSHYAEMREGAFEKWEFYEISEEEIHRCPTCHVSIKPDYYALYAIEISAAVCPDIRFSFHVPYPIGKAFLPPPEALPSVIHEKEEDGLFRFGRSLYSEEKVLYREKDVAAQLEQALTEARKQLGKRADE